MRTQHRRGNCDHTFRGSACKEFRVIASVGSDGMLDITHARPCLSSSNNVDNAFPFSLSPKRLLPKLRSMRCLSEIVSPHIYYSWMCLSPFFHCFGVDSNARIKRSSLKDIDPLEILCL